MESIDVYIPIDRRVAIANNSSIPERAMGTVFYSLIYLVLHQLQMRWHRNLDLSGELKS